MRDSTLVIIFACIIFTILYMCEDIFYIIWDYCNIKHIIRRFNKEGKRFYKSMNKFIYFLNKCHFALIEDGIEEHEDKLQLFYDKVTNIKNKFDRSMNDINKFNRYSLIEYIENDRIPLKFDNLVNKTDTVKIMKMCMNDFNDLTNEFSETVNKICS